MSSTSVIEVRDRKRVEAFARRRPLVRVYELGDLDDFFWPHTTWFALEQDGEIAQLALVYDEHDPAVLIALADPPAELAASLLESVVPRLPARVYAHVGRGLLGVLSERYEPDWPAEPHLKLGLVRTDAIGGHDNDVVFLGPGDLPEVAAFYERAYPGTWFQPRMLESSRYVGIRDGRTLACVAGVHVYSPRFRVAALGNVATLPSHRGHGLARRACARLCRQLLDDGIDVIGLNVRADNEAAIAVYRRLGFERVAEYDEVMLVQR